MVLHAFVDESVVSTYILAVALVPADQVADGRKPVRTLLQSGQKRLHFSHESDSRRGAILAGIEKLGLQHRIYVTRKGRNVRDVCLDRLVSDLVATGVRRLVIERDDTLVAADRKVIFEASRELGPELDYTHLRAKEDLLLCIPDAIAWCWSRGGAWRPMRARSHSRQREAPPTHRPVGCGAHFIGLVPSAAFMVSEPLAAPQ